MGATETKNLSELIYVESCHATAQGRTLFLTERLTQTGLLHLVAVIAIGKGESYMFCNSYVGQVHSAMDRSVSILSAWLSTCWQPQSWRTSLYEKQLRQAIHRTVFYCIFDKRNLSISKRTTNAQLVIELGFCILFGNDHLLIIISRGEVWTKQYAVQEFLARSKQAIYLRTSRIVF